MRQSPDSNTANTTPPTSTAARAATVSLSSLGSRPRTAQHLRAEETADAFTGLPPGCDQYEAIRLLKTTRLPGWTQTLIGHLELLLGYTRPQDWQPGQRPIVWLSVWETAHRLGLHSTNQVRRNETKLMQLGALTWRDSGNHRRYGHRDASGHITSAYGPDLSPTAALIPQLKTQIAHAHAERNRWHQLRSQLSQSRRAVKSAILTALTTHHLLQDTADLLLEELRTLTPRTTNATSLDALQDRITTLESLDNRLRALYHDTPDIDTDNATQAACEQPVNNSTEINTLRPDSNHSTSKYVCLSTHLGGPLFNTTTKYSLKPDVGRKAETNVQALLDKRPPRPHVSFHTLQTLLPERITLVIPPGQPIGWRHLIDAAAKTAPSLGISQDAWADACMCLGQETAALAVIIITIRYDRDLIRCPGGYLRELTRRGLIGELHLDQSVYALIDDWHGTTESRSEAPAPLESTH